MTNKQRIEFIEGQNTVLKHALAVLIVMHPNKKEIANLLKKISSYPEVISLSEIYQNGINSILHEIDDLSKTALHAALVSSQDPGKEN